MSSKKDNGDEVPRRHLLPGKNLWVYDAKRSRWVDAGPTREVSSEISPSTVNAETGKTGLSAFPSLPAKESRGGS